MIQKSVSTQWDGYVYHLLLGSEGGVLVEKEVDYGTYRGNGNYRVESVYLVKVGRPGAGTNVVPISCECPQHTIKSRFCKHMQMVEYQFSQEELASLLPIPQFTFRGDRVTFVSLLKALTQADLSYEIELGDGEATLIAQGLRFTFDKTSLKTIEVA